MTEVFYRKMVTVSLVLAMTVLTSCRKEAHTLAKIYVKDTAGQPFQGAEVRLYGEPTTSPHNEMILDQTQMSGADGVAIFDFSDYFKLGQAGFAVLTIELMSGDTLFGEGIIKIEEERMNEETLIIQPL